MRSGSPAISGASVRPSALVTVSLSSARALAPISCSAILHAGGGAAAHGVEHVGREPPGGDRHARPVDHGDQAQPGDQADLVRAPRRARPRRSLREPALELAQDRIPGVAAHADDEGKAEFLPVGGVEPAEAVELLRAQPVEAEPALFGLGVAGQVGALDPAAEFRVAADEGRLPLGRGLAGPPASWRRAAPSRSGRAGRRPRPPATQGACSNTSPSAATKEEAGRALRPARVSGGLVIVPI